MKQFNSAKISGRLKLFVEKGLSEEDFWDVCCDHGQAGMLALATRKFKTVHFVDSVVSIMERLQLELNDYSELSGPYRLYQLRAENLTKVTGTMLIAGIGGKLMGDIVLSLLEKEALQARRLLLSPHTDEKRFQLLIGHDLFTQQYRPVEIVPLDSGGIIKKLFVFDHCKL